jgi:hypothetical protein
MIGEPMTSGGFVVVSMTETVPAWRCATYARVPSGKMATATGTPGIAIGGVSTFGGVNDRSMTDTLPSPELQT